MLFTVLCLRSCHWSCETADLVAPKLSVRFCPWTSVSSRFNGFMRKAYQPVSISC